MKEAKTKQPKGKNDNSITNDFIILILSVTSLFIESIIIIIIGLFKKGIRKKEVLSENTNLGFDLIIRKR